MSLAIDNARVLDGRGGVQERRRITIQGGRIAAIDDAAATNGFSPSAADTIDAAGMTVMPGVIDCHVHLSIGGAADAMGEAVADTDSMAVIRMTQNSARTLAAGITTVRDMGAKNHIDLAFRAAIHKGVFGYTPRVLVSGRPITMTGGHCWQIGRQTDGVDDARRAAREQIKAGVDWIKLMATGGILTQGTELGAPQLGENEMNAAIEEAHKAGRRTAVHAHGATGIKNAVRAGIDSVEHAYFLDDEGIELMIERDCWLVPTAAAVKLVVEHGVEGGIPRTVVRKAESAIDSQVETCRKAWKAGVRLAMGTDAGTPYNRHGENMQELKAMVEIGLSPMEAIVMATSRSAALLGLDGTVGAVEVGQEADLLIVRGAPEEDVSLLREAERIEYVLQSGRIVARRGAIVAAEEEAA